MPHLTRTLILLLISSVTLFGQQIPETKRILAKLKISTEQPVLLPEDSRPNTRLYRLTDIRQRFQLENGKLIRLGRSSDRFILSAAIPEDAILNKTIEDLMSTGEFEYVEPDPIGSGSGFQGITPDDQFYSRQWGLRNDGTFPLFTATEGADIDMENAWDIEQGDSNIVVAIIDSGAKMNHPEFAGRIWRNWAEVPGNGLDDDTNGFQDDVQGWDFANDDLNPTDDVGHGSNVAGIIGVNGNNGVGFAGVDWNCKLMILKGLDDANLGFYSWWIEAIYYAVDNGAHVINLSLGGLSNSTTLRQAVEYAVSHNVVVVVSMLNDNTNTPGYPAAFNGVIAVGSTDPDDRRTAPFFWDNQSGSNFGNHISVVAPGNFVYGLSHESNNNYNIYWGGTSQSAPYVSGLAALLLAQDPNRTPAEIKSIIETSAEDQVGDDDDTPGWDQYYGHGRINAFNALVMTSVEKESSKQDQMIDVFPNPGNGSFSITIPKGIERIQIFNAVGKLVSEEEVIYQAESEFQMEVPGIYIIQLCSPTQKLSGRVIVH